MSLSVVSVWSQVDSGMISLHQDAEILAKGKLDETEGDGVRSNKVADVKDTGSPAELLALKVLHGVNWVRYLCEGSISYQLFS